MSAGCPARWVTMTARVRSVMRSAIERAEMFIVSGSASAKTGMQLFHRIGATPPGSVMGEEMTSWAMSIRSADSAECTAAVPEETAVAYPTP